MPVSRLLIQGAVKCPNWQLFRASLKGISTQQKLDELLMYVQPIDWKQRGSTHDRVKQILEWKQGCECDYMTRCIQAYNYMTALSRGGQIESVPDRYRYHDQVEAFLRTKRYVIKK